MDYHSVDCLDGEHGVGGEKDVIMSTRLRHTQRVKQKLEEKLQNLISQEDKLHSTIRDHVAKAAHRCQQILDTGSTSDFLSHYGKVAQMLEAASNTIDLLTISAEELIESTGFDDLTIDETLSWSTDKSILESTVLQSDSSVQIHHENECKESRSVHKSTYTSPVDKTDLNEHVTVAIGNKEAKGSATESCEKLNAQGDICDKNTETNDSSNTTDNRDNCANIINEVVKKSVEKYSQFEEELCGQLNQDVDQSTVCDNKSLPNKNILKSFEDFTNDIDTDIDGLSSVTCSSFKPKSFNDDSIDSRGKDSPGRQSSNNEVKSKQEVCDTNNDKTIDLTDDRSDKGTRSRQNSESHYLMPCRLLSGKVTPVIMGEIVSPWCFFVQICGPQLMTMMEKICEYMRYTGLRDSPMVDVCIGSLCLAKYYRDAIYYRAYVTEIYKSSGSTVSEVDVFFLDYGNRERVKIKDTRLLPQQFMVLPSQAICCALAEIMPCNKYCVWAEDDINLFRKYASGPSLSCLPQAIRTSSPMIPQIVQLTLNYPVPSMKPLPDGSYPLNEFSIGDLMIQAKRARHVGLPEQVGLLVKSGEGANEVSILKHLSVNAGTESDICITEVEDNKSECGKLTNKSKKIESNNNDEKVEKGKNELNSNVKNEGAKPKMPRAENVKKKVVETQQEVPKSNKQEEDKNTENVAQVVNSESEVSSNLEAKHESKLNGSNKSEPSETESQVAENKVHDIPSGGNGSRGQLDKIREEITENGSLDAQSSVMSATSSDFQLDQKSVFNDLQYDMDSLQFNPQGQGVMLSHVKTPHEFYVHIISQQCGEALDDLMKNLNTMFEKANCRKLSRLSKKFQPEVNKLCCAQFLKDNNFYRGIIKGTESENTNLKGLILVHYIDYGDEEWLPRARIFPLPQQFCKIPRLALQCNLVYIKPVPDESGEPVTWSEKSIQKFIEISGLEKTLHMHVVHGNLQDMKHCDPSQDIPSLGVLLVDYTGQEDICINIDLINEGVADFDPTPIKGRTDHLAKTDNGTSNAMDVWNPMAEDFFSQRNSYKIDTDDIGVATTGYKADDEEKICKFFSSGRECWRGDRCPYRHIQVHSGVTHDRDEVYAICDVHEDHLPVADSWVAIEITTILTPSHFYAVLPFGNRSLDKTISKSDNSQDERMGVSGQDETLDDLLAALSHEYSKRPTHDNTMWTKAIGEMVVARFTYDQQWYRARVLTVSEDKIRVFYVDFGNTEWLPEEEICDIKPEFLHLPFQAVECFLNIETKDNDTWSQQSKTEFNQLVDGKTLIAHVQKRSFNGCLWIDLYDTTTDDDINVGDIMVEKGLAKIVNVPIDIQQSSNTDSTKSSISADEVLIPG
ncbi:piRNA metabolic process [Mactra antiquata]